MAERKQNTRHGFILKKKYDNGATCLSYLPNDTLLIKDAFYFNVKLLGRHFTVVRQFR